MESLLIFLTILLLVLNTGVIYFLLKKNNTNKEDNSEKILRDEINHLKNSFNQSFGSMTKDIAKDMSTALTRVDEKVECLIHKLKH